MFWCFSGVHHSFQDVQRMLGAGDPALTHVLWLLIHSHTCHPAARCSGFSDPSLRQHDEATKHLDQKQHSGSVFLRGPISGCSESRLNVGRHDVSDRSIFFFLNPNDLIGLLALSAFAPSVLHQTSPERLPLTLPLGFFPLV